MHREWGDSRQSKGNVCLANTDIQKVADAGMPHNKGISCITQWQCLWVDMPAASLQTAIKVCCFVMQYCIRKIIQTAHSQAVAVESAVSYLTGLKPPRKSEVSVCWLQLMMCSCCPLISASIWHTVVLPVPVSPTSNAGSQCCAHLQCHCFVC